LANEIFGTEMNAMCKFKANIFILNDFVLFNGSIANMKTLRQAARGEQLRNAHYISPMRN